MLKSNIHTIIKSKYYRWYKNHISNDLDVTRFRMEGVVENVSVS